MKDNCYPYAIDISLGKGKTGQYSKPLVFECQPLLSSNIGGDSGWNYSNAFKKAFPNRDITIDIQGEKSRVKIKGAKDSIFIKNSEHVSKNEFSNINQGYYKHIHTGSFEIEISELNNKIHQRLYLPDEVSPDYYILQTNTPSEESAGVILNYFIPKKIQKIVLKAAVSHAGRGNIFVDITNKNELKNAITQMQQLSKYDNYFLAEEQKEFPRINRKTEKPKSGHLTYRLIGIANQDGDQGHFIASKSISDTIDSHQRVKMKCYFNDPGKTHQSEAGWELEACGPKDKYFGNGGNKIDIDPVSMHKISQHMYQLYTDIKSMSREAFKQHIDHLVACKNALASRKERIAKFTLPLTAREEKINKNDNEAFSLACQGEYEPLAEEIGKKQIAANTVNLKQLDESNYSYPAELKTMLALMEEKKYVKGLLTANREQLKYCFETKAAPTISKIFITAAINAKKKKLAQAKQLQSQSSINPIASLVNPIEIADTEEKPVLEKETHAQAGPSGIRSRLCNASFADNPLGKAAGTHANKDLAEENIIQKLGARIATSTLFTMPQNETNEEDVEKKQEKYAVKTA